MLTFLRPFFVRLFRPLIQALARTPVTPNMITVAGTIGVSAPCLALFPIGWLFPGAATATVFVFTDMLDGQLARIKGDSGKYGAFLDSAMDRFGDACVFGGITIWFMQVNHLLGGVSLFCLAGAMCTSYIKARAESLGLNANVGLIERPERLVIGLTSIGLSGLGIPYVLQIGMWGLAAGTAFTLYQRMRCVYLDAKAKGEAGARHLAAEPPVTRQPGAEQPGTDQSGADQSGAERPGTEQSGTERPGAEQSGAEQSGTERPATVPPPADPAPARPWEA